MCLLRFPTPHLPFSFSKTMRTNQNSYETPRVTIFGTVAELTRASFNNSQQDSIFFNGVVVGQGNGSLDACVSLNPKSPSGTCNVPNP